MAAPPVAINHKTPEIHRVYITLSSPELRETRASRNSGKSGNWGNSTPKRSDPSREIEFPGYRETRESQESRETRHPNDQILVGKSSFPGLGKLGKLGPKRPDPSREIEFLGSRETRESREIRKTRPPNDQILLGKSSFPGLWKLGKLDTQRTRS